jgi:uncharacterized membrane protein
LVVAGLVRRGRATDRATCRWTVQWASIARRTGSEGDAMNTRNLHIDMLRGVSIVMVMLLHYSLTYRLHARSSSTGTTASRCSS